jgi:hypothetical protein
MAANLNVSTSTRGQERGPDVAESTLRSIDRATKSKTGVSLFHWLTLASIGTSVGLFIAGKRELAIFIGLWPPTFQALRSATEGKQTGGLA